MAWNAAKVTGLGCSAGLGAAMALNRLPGSILFEVQPGDPAALGIAIAVLGAVAIAACWLAAREATRSDPARNLDHRRAADSLHGLPGAVLDVASQRHQE